MTIIYLSGENLEIEDFMAKHPEDFKSAGVLLSHFSLRRGSGRCHRRLVKILKENTDGSHKE